jgi:hypothetical protein
MIMNEYEYWVFLKQLNEEQRLIFDNFMLKKNLNVPMHLFFIGDVGIGIYIFQISLHLYNKDVSLDL